MPSPFPGMDPYLENCANWPDVHSSFISAARTALNAALPVGFVARTQERIYIVEPDQSIYPDIVVYHRNLVERSSPTSLSAVIDPPEIYTLRPAEVTETYLEVVATGQNRRVVSVIELLSPANKSRGRGREEYIRKRNELLVSDVHLMEIDLLRGGEQTVLIPKVQRIGSEYLVSLHRGDGSWRFEAWGFGLRDRLPRVGVPLAEGLSDVALDLQAILNEIYETGRYDTELDYTSAPEVPLSASDIEWVDQLLREAGYRVGQTGNGTGNRA
ncbi:MAG: DUF4058 family protein [Armatimonadaceae bacterium]